MANLTAETITSGAEYVTSLYKGIATKVVVVLVIILIGFIIAKLIGKVTKKTLHEVGLDSLVRKTGLKKVSLENLFSKIITYIIYFIVFLIALNKLGLTTDILHIISAGILVLLILLVLLSLKDVVPNIFAGFYIHQKGFIKPGDKIKVGNMEGKVKRVTLVETLVETKKKEIIYIPNSILIKKEVTKRK